jgi:hypothetical protein
MMIQGDLLLLGVVYPSYLMHQLLKLELFWDGLILATQVGCNRIEVNSDCMEVIDITNDGRNSLGAAAAIYEDCTLLCRSFTQVLFWHTPREANMAAHTLARQPTGDMSTVWHEDPPDFLVAVLANGVTIV